MSDACEIYGPRVPAVPLVEAVADYAKERMRG